MANRYRTHGCGEPRAADAGARVVVSGWVHAKRDHGQLLFVDLRDPTGIVQAVASSSSCGQGGFEILDELRPESVVRLEGELALRQAGMTNPQIPTGEVELRVQAVEVLSRADPLPFAVADTIDAGEALRLRYRFLDLRRPRLQRNLRLRSQVISSLRRRMEAQGFQEFQTPILTSSSPEGARDYLVPSRLHPGQFYALPQAPQQFKQLIMMSGFPRYFQIAPCFRDEDARADRSPGEFYQLDIEMSFVEQDDIFAPIEQVLAGLFREFSSARVTEPPFPRVPYAQALLKYGSDKPDLRFGAEIADVSEVFRDHPFRAFAQTVAAGGVVRALAAPGAAAQPRRFFDELQAWAQEKGGQGVAYFARQEGGLKGPLAKFLSEPQAQTLERATAAVPGSAVFFLAGPEAETARLAGQLRLLLADRLDLRAKDEFRFCWIVDFPMYERNEETGAIDFCHNPFSMPQGGLEALRTMDPLKILAYQYDIVCNGVELSSGAIRNHRPDIMYEAFALAGYSREDVEEKFRGMINAFKLGAPPHGGLAPGIDRIVMLLAGEPNIREVILFPFNQQAQDLMMNAPCRVTEKQLRELHIRVVE